jgi:pyruvate,water dikinase
LLVGNPELALQHSMLPNDGVGLCRMEFVISNYVRAHPLALLHIDELNDDNDRQSIRQLIHGFENDGAEFFKQTLARGIATICAAFYPRPVILRFRFVE